MSEPWDAERTTPSSASGLPAWAGGQPRFRDGPPDWPPADDDVHAALEQAYRSGDWGRYAGSCVERLTELLARRHGVAHALPCASGTVAVELALRGLGIAAGDEVLLAGYDFPGNFRAIEVLGARPVLIDLEPDSWCLDVSQVERAVGPQTRALVVSHLHGSLAPMPQIRELADRLGLSVLEDACQAPGARIAGRLAGTWGDVGVLSFGGSKLLTAGRGGALITDRSEVLQRARIFADRGNNAFPLSELQAAVLPPQWARLDDRNRYRAANVQRLLASCRQLASLRPPAAASSGDEPVYYKVGWRYHAAACGGHSREQFVAAVRAEGIALDVGFRSFVRRSSRRCRRAGPLPCSEHAGGSTVLLHHPVLLEPPESMERLADALRRVTQYLAAHRAPVSDFAP